MKFVKLNSVENIAMNETWRDHVDPVAVMMCIKATDDEDEVMALREAQQRPEESLTGAWARFVESDIQAKIAKEELHLINEKKKRRSKTHIA